MVDALSDSLVDAVSDSPSDLPIPPSVAPPKELIDLAPLMYFTPALLTFGAACVALGLTVYFLTSLSDLTDDLINPYTLVERVNTKLNMELAAHVAVVFGLLVSMPCFSLLVAVPTLGLRVLWWKQQTVCVDATTCAPVRFRFRLSHAFPTQSPLSLSHPPYVSQASRKERGPVSTGDGARWPHGMGWPCSLPSSSALLDRAELTAHVAAADHRLRCVCGPAQVDHALHPFASSQPAGAPTRSAGQTGRAGHAHVPGHVRRFWWLRRVAWILRIKRERASVPAIIYTTPRPSCLSAALLSLPVSLARAPGRIYFLKTVAILW